MSFDVPVRWQDLDALGHVNHAVYLTYFEEQRDHWFNERLGLTGNDYVVASAHIVYKAPILQEDGPVRISGSVARIGGSSLTLTAELRSARGHLCADIETAIVLWDGERKKSRPLTDAEREALQADLQPVTPAPSLGGR